MIVFFDWSTIVVSLFLLIRNIRTAFNGSRYLVYLIFFVFYVLPLILDYVVEMADYTYSMQFLGYIVSRSDVTTNIIYDVSLLFSQCFILYYHKDKESNRISTETNGVGKHLRFWLIVCMLVPAIGCIVLIHQPKMLYTFQWREQGLFLTTGSYASIEKFTYLAISSSVFLIFSQTRVNLIVKVVRTLFYLFFLFINICIQGKRGILFFAIVNVALIIYYRYFINDRGWSIKKIMIGAISAFVLTGFLIFFTVTVKVARGYSEQLESVMYTSTRVDFLRDDRVRMSIFSEVHPDKMRILKYHGQTIISDALSIVPINYLADLCDYPPYTYQSYFTHALEGNAYSDSFDVSSYNYETVTIFAEFISNFGIVLGLLIMALFCHWVIKIANHNPYPGNLFILCSFFLLNLYPLPYVIFYVEATFILVIFSQRKRFSGERTLARRG